MAFVQQHRRQRQRSPPLDTSTDDELTTTQPTIPIVENHILLAGQTPSQHGISVFSNTSDSETDWHDISSAIRSSLSDTTSSFSDVLLPPTATTSTSSILSIDRRDSLSIGTSESESYSSVRPSDTESFSDIDLVFDALPSHDGTGAFAGQDDLDRTSEEETARHLDHDHHDQQRQNTENRLVVIRASTASDFEPTSPSMPNILLPYGGIHLPSFASTANNPTGHLPPPPISTPYYSISTLDQRVPPQFQPTVFPNDVMVSSDEQFSLLLSSQRRERQQQQQQQQQQQNFDDSGDGGATDESSADQQQLKFTRKRQRNLDRIPTHHPSFPGTISSFAILSAIWNNLRRLTNHLIENDTYTADAFTTLVSEATLEGCLPFGSHLHMELAAGLRPAYASRRYEGLPGM